MTVPLIVLAVLSTVGGLVGVPYALSSMVGDHPTNYIEQTLEPVISKAPAADAHGAEPPKDVHWLSPAACSHTDGAPAFTPLAKHRRMAQSTRALAGGNSHGTPAHSGFGAHRADRHRNWMDDV